MKRLLLPLLAALALPTAVNAESYWLILTYGDHGTLGGGGIGGGALEKIQMLSLDSCEKEGKKWENSPTQKERRRYRKYHCVTGK